MMYALQKEHNEQQTLGARSDRGMSSLATLFDAKEGSIDPLGIRGLGFRAAIPKMPSFRKIVSL